MAWNAVESNPTSSRRRRFYNKQNKPVLVTEEVQRNWYDCRPNQTTIFRKKNAVGAPSFNTETKH